MTYTFHTRLEPRTRSDDLAHGLAARVYDATWMLARQWQLGELTGDDGGTPIRVRHTGEATWCSAYSDKQGRKEIAPGAGPIEAWAEAFVEPQNWTLRRRVDLGRAFVRRLRRAKLASRAASIAAAFEFDVTTLAKEPSAAGLLDLVADRIPDGAKLYAKIEPTLRATTPKLPSISGVTIDQDLVDVALDWLAWCDHLLGQRNTGAWDARRLEHSFTVEAAGTGTTLELTADAHDGGEVDWWSFDAAEAAAQTGAAKPIEHDVEIVPTRVSFRGMPTPRWWEEEDASIDLGGIDAHPADLSRMALLHFTLVYGNDHFVAPVRMPVGSVFRTNKLLVTDTFGATVSILPAAQQGTASQVPGAPRWTMFTLSLDGAQGVADAFLLPASAMLPLTSAPLEDVHLLRDEMANLAFAVEHTFEGHDGRPQRRIERAIEPLSTTPGVAGVLTYRRGTTVPEHWFPLVPQRAASGDAPELKVQKMSYSPHPDHVPKGTFVVLGGTFADDRIPREGRQIRRDRVRARWSDGTTWSWERRRTSVGRGEGTSGLRFDLAEHKP